MSKAEGPWFEVLAPKRWHVPAVFNSPHSGSAMPEAFLQQSVLKRSQLRLSEDYLVDELFSACVDYGAPMLRAIASRAYLDLNREPFELDPRMFEETLPGYMNGVSQRVSAGFGTIPRFVGEGLEIYRNRLPLSEAHHRIETFYKPYHRLLTGLLDQCHSRCGFVLLLDCHSMPEADLANRKNQPDIVLGDRYGAACGSEITNAAEAFFSHHGLRVARNRPYAGGFITETHGARHRDRHALQIELNRGLYMDERKRCRSPDFKPLKKILDAFASGLAALIGAAVPQPWQRAAE